MKILNLYAGIGGNRKLWGDEHKVTAVERNQEIGKAYQDFEYVQKVCIDNQLNLVPIFGEVDSIHYSGCITDLTNFQETLIKEGTGGKPEGIVYKFEPVLLNKYKERLMFKCKFKDFSEFRLTSKLKQWRNKNE